MPNYILLERIELNASAASVTFANIPQTGYTDLKVVVNARSTTSNTGYGRLSLLMALNGSSTTFTGRDMLGFGSDGSGSTTHSTGRCGWINANDATSNTFSLNEINLLNYTSSNNKAFSVDFTTENNNTGQMVQGMAAGLWSTTSSISSITFTIESGYSFAQYSTFSLYGVAAVGTTPNLAPKASGGNTITTDGTYWYHAFLTSGTFTPISSLTADVLTIAGGGGGQGGGGGSGGLVYSASQSLSATGYVCTVGAGGASLTNGVNSQFGALTAAVGGGGASSWGDVGKNGGSGGGGASTSGTTVNGGTGTAGQGNNGGSGVSNGGGGGGGAGAAGSNGNTNGGAGGIGLSTYSSWGSATNTGQNSGGTYYYAGGGGGGNNSGASPAGGLGGGGTGSNASPTAGTANTGGGGGGAYNAAGQPGGSGIVIVRYAV